MKKWQNVFTIKNSFDYLQYGLTLEYSIVHHPIFSLRDLEDQKLLFLVSK
jgi:hypothetical protein